MNLKSVKGKLNTSILFIVISMLTLSIVGGVFTLLAVNNNVSAQSKFQDLSNACTGIYVSSIEDGKVLDPKTTLFIRSQKITVGPFMYPVGFEAVTSSLSFHWFYKINGSASIKSEWVDFTNFNTTLPSVRTIPSYLSYVPEDTKSVDYTIGYANSNGQFEPQIGVLSSCIVNVNMFQRLTPTAMPTITPTYTRTIKVTEASVTPSSVTDGFSSMNFSFKANYDYSNANMASICRLTTSYNGKNALRTFNILQSSAYAPGNNLSNYTLVSNDSTIYAIDFATNNILYIVCDVVNPGSDSPTYTTTIGSIVKNQDYSAHSNNQN